MGRKVICTNCGSKIKNGQRFCSNCGTAIEIDVATNEHMNNNKKRNVLVLIGILTVFIVVGLIVLVLSLNRCEHEFSEASCTQLSTCTKCGKTQGDFSNHIWIDADCTKPKTCNICSKTEGEPSDHSYVAATCTTAKKCNVCGVEDGTALGHTSSESCTRCGYVDKSVAIENAKKAIYVYGIDLEVNSVGGVDTYITWKNVSDKEIKYIHFSVQYYNSVKDVLRNDIGGATTTKLTFAGPFPKGKGNYDYYAYSGDTAECLYFKISSGFERDRENGWAGQYWEAPFYNTTTKYIKMSQVEIEYMDGSLYTISDPDALAAIIGNGSHPNSWSTNDPGDDYLR